MLAYQRCVILALGLKVWSLVTEERGARLLSIRAIDYRVLECVTRIRLVSGEVFHECGQDGSDKVECDLSSNVSIAREDGRVHACTHQAQPWSKLEVD